MTLRAFSGFSRSQAGGLLHPGYRSGGAYYGSIAPGVTTGAMVADTIYAIPIRIAAPVQVQYVAMRVVTGTPGVFAKGALYTNLLAGGTLIAEGTAAMDLTSAVIVGYVFASNPILQPGIVWAAWKFNGAAQIACPDPASSLNQDLFNLVGQAVANPFTASGTAITGARRADAYANAFPATFGAVTWTAATPGPPCTAMATV